MNESLEQLKSFKYDRVLFFTRNYPNQPTRRVEEVIAIFHSLSWVFNGFSLYDDHRGGASSNCQENYSMT